MDTEGDQAMSVMTRRQFVKTTGRAGAVLLGAAAAGGLTGCAATLKGDVMPKQGRRVVVIGGGWGGATAAKYLRAADPSIEVVLLEPSRQFVSCPFSNLVLSGVRTIDSLTMSYNGLRRRGVRILHEAATALEPDRRRVRVGEGYIEYDRCVVSPGIEFQWDQVEGLAQHRADVLHAPLLKHDRRNPADDTLKAAKALLKTIPDERLADLAAYYSSLDPRPRGAATR